MMLKKWLAHPLTRGYEIDDPQTTELRRQILQQKSFLRKIYQCWYELIKESLPEQPGPVLELGSGAGFLSDFIPGVITSDVIRCSHVDLVLNGHHLPFGSETLRGVVMTDTLHHLSNARRFFSEANRCLKTGGVIAMIEPWVTNWSRFIYQSLHEEPFLPYAPTWEFPEGGPLSGANQALPWILFQRDRSIFEKEFPALRIHRTTPMMPFVYLLSGGMSLRSLMPGFTFGLWRGVEKSFQPWIDRWALFAEVVLVKSG